MLTRREFNRTLVAALAGAALGGDLLRGQQEGPPLRCFPQVVNTERLWRTLQQLAEFDSQTGPGTTRLGFSSTALAARNWLMGLLGDAGLEVSLDAAANIRARRPGRQNDLPALWFGSHLDTVPSGGDFDGAVGSLGALEAVRVMNEQGVRTERPLELVIFSNEEGVHYGKGLFGSRALAGLLEPGELDEVDPEGVALAEWIRRYGGDPARIPQMTPPPESLHAYLELHIEQGNRLWSRGIPLGLVEGIVGILRYRVTLEGEANHAGTTSMDRRRDALVTASRIILAVREIVTREPGRQVGTVGEIEVEPGAPNIVPGNATFPVELRDLSMDKLRDLAQRIRDRAAHLAAQDGVGFRMTAVAAHEPAMTSARLRREMQQLATNKMRAPTLTMASGAGHDAQSMATLCPVGMIFVPSKDGISHAPEEYSRPEEIACGAELLYHTLLRLDQIPTLE